MSASYIVDPSTLDALAAQAQALADELASLAVGVGEVGVDVVGDPGLAAAIEAFHAAWSARAGEMQAELSDAAEFLRTFADVAAQMDGQVTDVAE